MTGSESPVVVVLSESMEPGFARGDILFLRMSKDPIRAGEIVVFNVDGRDIPIVHRVIKVHEQKDTGEVYVLTKVASFAILQETITMTMTEACMLRASGGCTDAISWGELLGYILIGALGLLVITSKD
ncbi:signal peptidase complex catalytic subunit SEC11C-like [Pyrus ussuriensis x Pyrus communis]|uniref:Signal peptidase complex catalytic subunit SEC11 n=1 Tax=Pyrus ussuriensis x Pyrus communis TaxID=2448454 RepID=A0A5N5GU16_9ROSA|nr:signal peptidase complex catalytic subunit SEC11C-like [Pyrus ussuriensis x Pyrus communis]